jgi:hypothetical protein
MGASTSEVGYTSATTRRGNHKVYMDMWWHWKKNKNKEKYLRLCCACSCEGGDYVGLVVVVDVFVVVSWWCCWCC